MLVGGGVVMGARAARRRRPAASAGRVSAAIEVSDREVLRREQIADIQRQRLLAAAAAVVDELGYAQTTVAHVTDRARVSRRTFYELFANRDECLLAVLEEALAAVGGELEVADLARLAWRERMRRGLEVILGFLDREPVLARVCLVQALHGGPRVLELRNRVLGRLAAAVDQGRRESSRAPAGCTALTAEGAVGAAHAILYARLARRDQARLLGLLGELTGIVVLPYLGSAAARREQLKPVPAQDDGPHDHSRSVGDLLAGIEIRLTYRTARVLREIAAQPGASNRLVADRAGIHDPGQVSKLLARLQRLGLIDNQGVGAHAKGEPNAWTLTAKGRQLLHSINVGITHSRQAA